MLLLLLPLPALAAEPNTVEAATEALVAILTDSAATEYTDARQIHYPAGKTGMALVFFTLESFGGGNNSTYYLAVFEPSWKDEAQETTAETIDKYRLVGYLPVGGDGWRSVDFADVVFEKDQITIKTEEYADNDAMCCPSKPGTATFKLENNRLTEITPQ